MLRKGFVLMMMVTVVFFLCSFSSADVPDSINYQGKLTTASGGCLNDTVQMTFTIYADESGTVSEWTETQTEVAVKEGVFNVLLGSVMPLSASVFDGSAKYLGVQVESDPEMTPLKPMVSVAYAYRSQHADTAEYANTLDDGDWSFAGDDIYRLEGKIGIGTTIPDGKFTIRPSSGANIENVVLDGELSSAAVIIYKPTSGTVSTNNNIGAMMKFRSDVPGEKPSHIVFYTNDAGSLGERMRMNSSGNVGIGTTSPQGALDVNSTTGAFIVPRMTTAQRDALTAVNGMIIYNTTTNQFNFYENSAWVTK